MKLYVEGGGDSAALKAVCRKGFSDFLGRAGIPKKPRMVACGSRQNAYDSFLTAVMANEAALLLVDSEDPVAAQHQSGETGIWQPWTHLAARDKWTRPKGAQDMQCHMMVQCMEAWFLADRNTLAGFFGQGFAPKQLPSTTRDIESIAKDDIYRGLSDATKSCKTKTSYGKGEHSFTILSLIDPKLVIAASPWAGRFIEGVKEAMGV